MKPPSGRLRRYGSRFRRSSGPPPVMHVVHRVVVTGPARMWSGSAPTIIRRCGRPSGLRCCGRWSAPRLLEACSCSCVVERRCNPIVRRPSRPPRRFVVVLVGSVLAAIVRIAPLRLAPLLPAVMVPGLTRSDSPRAAVLGFAAVALFLVAALYAAGTRPWRRWLSIALSIGALITFGTRVLYRDPFRELRCAPACMDNPWLRAHAPDLLRGSERVLAVLTLAWVVVAAASQLRRRAAPSAHAASTLVVLAVAAAWATRLLQQPRPAPGHSVDRWLTIGLLGAVAAATVLRARRCST